MAADALPRELELLALRSYHDANPLSMLHGPSPDAERLNRWIADQA
jgi:hypothetical protein